VMPLVDESAAIRVFRGSRLDILLVENLCVAHVATTGARVAMPTTIELFGGTMLSPVRDPYAVYRRLRREAPVLLVQGILGEDYLVTRHDDVRTILTDPERFSSRGNARSIGLVMGRTILEMEGKEHLRHRNLVTPFFGPSAVRGGLDATIERIAHALVDEFAAAGHADLVPQFTFTFPLRVICGVIGIPVDDYAAFHRWAIDLISVGDDPPRGFAAAERIVEYLRPILADRRREPRSDLLSKLAHAEVEGQRLGDEEVLSFLRLLLPAGAETTYRLIGSMLYALLTHPDALAGVEIPAGHLVSAALGSANRDERRHRDPDRFDLHRAADEHLAFGFGQHFCAGSHLARAEARIAVGALLDRLPNLRLAPGEASTMLGLAFRSPDRLPVRFG
jgi:cytochrome P450